MKIIKLTLFIYCVCFAGAAFADNGSETDADGFVDRKLYWEDTSISVYLYYKSFVNEGFTEDFPDITQDSLEDIIHRTIDQLMNSSGVRLKLEYKGLTNISNINDIPRSSIVIRAKHKNKATASALVRENNTKTARTVITFYRYGVNEDGSAAEFTWSAYSSGGYGQLASINSIMMHEMGHAIGLEHNNNEDGKSPEIATLASMMTNPSSGSTRFHLGPYKEDIEDLQDMYSIRDPLRIKVLRSTDGGKSWLARETNLDRFNINTQMPMSMVRDADRMMLAYTDVHHKPNFIVSDETGRVWENSSHFSNESSLYGTAVGGYDDEYMLAWVTNDTNNKVRVRFSKDGGNSWSACNPSTSNFTSRASGTPAINKVSGSTWILAYPKMENDENGFHGSVVARVSGDDCRTWSDEFEVFGGEHALGGVSIASKGKNEIMLAFANGDYAAGDVGNIITLTLSIDANDRIKNGKYKIESSSISTLSEPSIALSSERWLMAYRTPDGKIRTRTKKSFDNSWSNMQKPIDQAGYTDLPLPVAPAVAAYRGGSSKIMFMVIAVPEDSPANGILD